MRKAVPLVVGVALFGLATGAGTAQAPLPDLALFIMPMVIYAGVAQLAFAQLYALGAPFPSILATLVLINLRYVFYAAIASTWPRPRSRLLQMLCPALMTETPFVLSLNEPLTDRFRFLLGAGATLWMTWVVTCTLGALLSSQLPPLKHGYAIPAIVLAPIVMGLLKGRQKIVIAGVAVVLGLLLLSMPYRLGPMIAGLAAVLLVMAGDRFRRAWR